MTGRTIADLLANLDRKPRLVAIDGPKGLGNRAFSIGLLVEELPGFGISERKSGPGPARFARSDGGRVRSTAIFDSILERIKAEAGSGGPSNGLVETLRVPWIVTDFDFLGFDLLRASWTGWEERSGSTSALRRKISTSAWSWAIRRDRVRRPMKFRALRSRQRLRPDPARRSDLSTRKAGPGAGRQALARDPTNPTAIVAEVIGDLPRDRRIFDDRLGLRAEHCPRRGGLPIMPFRSKIRKRRVASAMAKASKDKAKPRRPTMSRSRSSRATAGPASSTT